MQRLSIGILNAPIKAPENLLERVIVTFAMSTGQIRVGTGRFGEQRGILQQKLVRSAPLANPKFILPFTVPRQARFSPVDLEPVTIFAARTDLADGETSAGAIAHAKHHRRVVFGVD